MGTRAIITKEGKPIIATHWDGYPDGLGKGLKEMPDLSTESIIKVAEMHEIDFIDSKIGRALKKKRIEELAKKHNLTIEEIKQGKRRGQVISSGDYEIGNIKIYDDWAEYQYDIRQDGIYYRVLHGSWKEGRTPDEWVKLTDAK